MAGQPAGACPCPPPQRRGWPTWATVLIVLGVIVVPIIAVTMGTVVLVGILSRPMPPVDFTLPTYTPIAIDSADDDQFYEMIVALDDTIDDYRNARDDGSLWLRIADSDYNRTAVNAFLYILIDMKTGARFGADTSDYLDRLNELERRLLADEPLGVTLEIVLDDKSFKYDGDTGEGGHSARP
jgi:hypothetical protein